MYIPTRTYPHPVPDHDCPGRKVTCPDCGQAIRVAPQPIQYPQIDWTYRPEFGPWYSVTC